MTRSARWLTVLMTSALMAGCASSASSDGDAGTGSGGTSATGGSGSGGQMGSGGAGSGGTSGSGGAHASGGTVGTGGATTGSGGSGSGSGGSGSGGATGSGGSATGGATGSGGNGSGGSGTAGANGTGGAAGEKGAGGATGGKGAGGAAAGGSGNSGGGSGSASYKPCPTTGDPCKVLPLGDSITYGLITVAADKASSDASVNGKDSHGGYRVKLFGDAVGAGKKMTFVGSQTNGPTTVASMPFPKSHEGWSGYTIAQIQAKAANDVASAPNIILLHAGTNDTYMSDPSGAPMRLATFVDYLITTFPNALIFVAEIIPYPSQAPNVKLINQSIPAMVQTRASAGKHVVVIDLFTGFDPSTMQAGDGVHPNQSGYDWMGDKWYAAISDLLPN